MRKIIKGSSRIPVVIQDIVLDDEPSKDSTNPVTSGGVANAINASSKDLLDDESREVVIIDNHGDAEYAAQFTKGLYYVVDNDIFECTDITNDGDDYTIELTKKDGVIPVINSLAARIAALED